MQTYTHTHKHKHRTDFIMRSPRSSNSEFRLFSCNVFHPTWKCAPSISFLRTVGRALFSCVATRIRNRIQNDRHSLIYRQSACALHACAFHHKTKSKEMANNGPEKKRSRAKTGRKKRAQHNARRKINLVYK